MKGRKNRQCRIEKSITILVSIIFFIFGFVIFAWVKALAGYPSTLNKIKELNAPYVIVKYEK